MRFPVTQFFVFIFIPVLLSACKKDNQETGTLEIISCSVGEITLNESSLNANIPVDQDFTIKFSAAVDSSTIMRSIILRDAENLNTGNIYFRFSDEYKTVLVKTLTNLGVKKQYTLDLLNSIKGKNGEAFQATQYPFSTISGVFSLKSIRLNNQDFNSTVRLENVLTQGSVFSIEFSESVDTTNMKSYFALTGNVTFNVLNSNSDKIVNLQCAKNLLSYQRYDFTISSSLKSKVGNKFEGFTNWFKTGLDSTLKFPNISDDELLTLIQKQTFKFFWDYGHPTSGLTRERLGSGDVVTSGGSGFGLMAILIGIERGFITRQEGFERLQKIVTFLNNPNTDKFHGAFPHWLNGSTGKVIPFSTKDNGADIVETSYLMQGLLTVRAFFKNGSAEEKQLCDTITQLWENVEWNWFRQGTQNVLYWHWSPNYGWEINMQVRGWSECLILYVMAASSPTFSIPKEVYDVGWARNGAYPMKNGKTFYGITLPLSYDYGGPLFWAHYSFLGLDPRNLSDQYANYWDQNTAHSRINYEYCRANPKQYLGYSADCWGLTACDIPDGYSANEPTNDNGVIAPTAAISSIAYTPDESMAAIRFFYYILGDKLWGDYGFYDSFALSQSWWASSFLAIDQGPEICMIENYRTGFLWNLFMSDSEVQNGLSKLGFTY